MAIWKNMVFLWCMIFSGFLSESDSPKGRGNSLIFIHFLFFSTGESTNRAPFSAEATAKNLLGAKIIRKWILEKNKQISLLLMLMELLSFPKHSTLLGLHLHPFPTSVTAGVRLGLNQTPHPAPGTNMQRGGNPPWEHLQCLLSWLLLIPWPPAANRGGQDLAYLITSAPGAAELGLLQKVTKSGILCSGTYAEHISHSPSRLSQEPKELGPFSLS